MTHPKQPGLAQKKAFQAAARAAECDEDEKAFEARLKKVAKANPKKPAK